MVPWGLLSWCLQVIFVLISWCCSSWGYCLWLFICCVCPLLNDPCLGFLPIRADLHWFWCVTKAPSLFPLATSPDKWTVVSLSGFIFRNRWHYWLRVSPCRPNKFYGVVRLLLTALLPISPFIPFTPPAIITVPQFPFLPLRCAPIFTRETSSSVLFSAGPCRDSWRSPNFVGIPWWLMVGEGERSSKKAQRVPLSQLFQLMQGPSVCSWQLFGPPLRRLP